LKNAFFLLGIGGMGMSAIAHYLVDRGDTVAGADRQLGLIRIGGHLSYGGYDVPHVPQEAGTPRTPAVH
jgi:hypothetical protein